jgi:hypothetical protein
LECIAEMLLFLRKTQSLCPQQDGLLDSTFNKICCSVLEGKNEQYALIVPLLYFYVLAPTCFGSSLPSSGSLLDPPELLENTD